MNFIKQTGIEIKNILRSKFILIIGIIVLALGSIIYPLGSFIIQRLSANPLYPGGPPIVYETRAFSSKMFDEMYEDTITVKGITITSNNPFFWNLRNLVDEQNNASLNTGMFTDPKALDIYLELIDVQIDHYLRLATVITTYEDYRVELAWQTNEYGYYRLEGYVNDKFIYEHSDVESSVLFQVVQYKMYVEEAAYLKKYVDITPQQRLIALGEAEDKLENIYMVIETNNFPMYVQMRIEQETDSIGEKESQIALHEKTIIDDPSQEEYLNSMIEQLQKDIDMIKTNNIPIWEYRLAKNIVPMDGSWQNTAISDIESNRYELSYKTIMTEEQFVKEIYLIQEYGSYPRYVKRMQTEIDEINKKILIAQNSLDAEKPDMKYVPDGARAKTVGFLGYSIFVALFAVLAGGWIIAREFSGGTIRLLMIRPKTRTKILMSKFLAAFIVCVVIYAAGIILNFALNGILYGFSDFGFPNFTASGEVGFIGYYIPKFLACIVTILLGYSCAFMMSTVTKNTAVSIIVPVVCFIGSFLGMNFLQYSRAMNWMAYTPIPYVQISSFFAQWSPVNTLISRGVPINLTYGIIFLLVLSVIFTVVAVLVFRKKDITK